MTPAVAGNAAGITSKILELLIVESLNAGRAATWVLLWTIFGAIFTFLVWLGLVGALVGAAIALGVPWMIAAVAVTAAHILAAVLIFLLCVRIGRRLAPAA